MKILSLIMFVSACFACQQPISDTSKHEIDALNSRIDALERKLDSLMAKEKEVPVVKKKKPKTTSPTQTALPVVSTPTSSPTASSNYNSQPRRSTQTYSVRCQAITKKGTQCKRNARSGGYCWQHGG